MKPYQQIFPNATAPSMTMEVSRKVGSIPKGRYTFFECYCVDPSCDCRRADILVVNEKGKQKAAISFGFDPDQPLAGPFLNEFEKQGPFAEELLEVFVDAVNGNGEWLSAMYDRYKAVRAKIDGKPYRGKPFPKPGKVKRRVISPAEVNVELERMMQDLQASTYPQPPRKAPKPAAPLQAGLFDDLERSASSSAASKAREQGLESLLDLYVFRRGSEGFLDSLPLEKALRNYLFSNAGAGDELAELLVASFDDGDRGEAVLRLLSDVLEILRVELERRRPGSRQRMERVQGALARRVFLGEGDGVLCSAVTDALLQSRVEILPVLHEAHQRRMLEEAESHESRGFSEQEILDGLFQSIEEMGLTSPFEGCDAMLQLFALAEPDMQIALSSRMLVAPNPLIREIAALMLYHPSGEVRLGVSRELAEIDGRSLTPEMLRRLIISRNWFDAAIRKNLDRAISNARRGRVECASLPGAVSMQVYASAVDGAGAQSFQVIIPDGKGFASCALLLKQGVGVADAFLVPLKGKRELKGFIAMMHSEACLLESTPEYLDQRVCHALAEGARLGNAPLFWLVTIAEVLGRDQWKGVEREPRAELARLREELAAADPKLLSEREAGEALAVSGQWPITQDFAGSWFEDDLTLDRAVEGGKERRGKRVDPVAAVTRILDVCISERRELWLERLVATTCWLKSIKKPPLPWHRMFHVAEALADQKRPIREIPLMLSVAEQSLEAYFGRREERGW